MLLEDLYETLHGDGTFRYFDSVFDNNDEAQKRVASSNSSYKYHPRSLTLFLDGEFVNWRDFRLELFDHYDPETIVTELERKLFLNSLRTVKKTAPPPYLVTEEEKLRTASLFRKLIGRFFG